MDVKTMEIKLKRDVDCIDSIIISTAHSKGIHFSITIYKDDIPNFASLELEDYMAFFDIFGFCEEFKQIFTALESVTNMSKDEISTLLRKEKNCKVYHKNINFEFIL